MKNRIASIGTITAALALSVACSNGSASNFEQPTSVASTVTARQGNDRGNGGNSITFVKARLKGGWQKSL